MNEMLLSLGNHLKRDIIKVNFEAGVDKNSEWVQVAVIAQDCLGHHLISYSYCYFRFSCSGNHGL